MSVFSALFAYDFIIKAVVVGSLVSLCAALTGVTLVLKRYSMIGDGLSHVAFGAVAIGLAINSLGDLQINPLYISIPVVLAAAFLLLRLSDNSKVKGDAVIAIISSSALAFGIVVTSLSKGMNVDVNSYLFGSILATSQSDVYISVTMSVIVLCLYLIFYKKIFIVTFDENFARATGVNVGLYNMLIAFLTAIVIVIGMKIIGTLLISSLIIFPALSSMRVFKSFKGVVISSAIISVVCFFAGIFLSFYYSIPAGASVVLSNLAVFIIFSIVGYKR